MTLSLTAAAALAATENKMVKHGHNRYRISRLRADGSYQFGHDLTLGEASRATRWNRIYDSLRHMGWSGFCAATVADRDEAAGQRGPWRHAVARAISH